MGLRLVQLAPGVRQLAPGVRQLCLPRPVLRPAVIQGLPALDELVHAIPELGFAVPEGCPLGVDGVQDLLPVLLQEAGIGLLQPLPEPLKGFLDSVLGLALRQGAYQLLQSGGLLRQPGDGAADLLPVRQGGGCDRIPERCQSGVGIGKEGSHRLLRLRVLCQKPVHQLLRIPSQHQGEGRQPFLKLRHTGLIFRLAALQLLPSGGQLGGPVLIPRQAVLILGKTHLILRQAVLVLPPAILELRQAVSISRLVVIQCHQGVGQLLLGIRQALLPALGFPGQGLLSVPVFLPAVIQRFPGVQKLFPGVGKLGVGLGLGVGKLPLGVRELFIGLVHNLLPPQGRPDLRQRLQVGNGGVHQGLVGIGEGHLFRRAIDGEIGGGIVIHGEGALRKAQEGRCLAGAQGGGPPLHADVEGGLHHAHHGELRPGQGIRIGPLGPELHGVAHRRVHLGEHQFVRHALILRLRQSALQHREAVQLLRQGVDLHHGVAALGVRLPGGGEGVDEEDALRGLCRGLRRQGGDVVLREAQGGEDLNVHEMRLVHIAVDGLLHVRRRGPEAGEEGHRQRRQNKNGEEAALAVLHLPQEILLQRPHHDVLLSGNSWLLTTRSPLPAWGGGCTASPPRCRCGCG